MNKTDKFDYTHKEPLIRVDKVWGEEIWLVNCDEYCGKLLLLNKNAESSYHCHRKKKETFFAIEGYAILTIEDKEYVLAPYTHAKTVLPGEKHKFFGFEQAVILEVSTHHEDEDIERFSESKPGRSDSEIALGEPQQ